MKVLSFSDGKSASETKFKCSDRMYANYFKTEKVGSSLSREREMPSMLWFVSSGSDHWHYFASLVSSLSQTRPSLDLVTSAGEEEGGRMRTWRSADTEACLGLVWAVGSLGARPGLNISRSRPPDLCQEAATGPRRPFMLDFKARRI